MKKLSVSEVIYEYLKERAGELHAGYEFVNKTVVVGNSTYWLGSSSDRKARQLAIDGKIERIRKGKYALYRYPKKELSEEEKYALFEPKVIHKGAGLIK